MFDLLADRLAALVIGLLLGVVIAVGLMVFVADIDQWWILVATPAACALVAGLIGDPVVDLLKRVAWWISG